VHRSVDRPWFENDRAASMAGVHGSGDTRWADCLGLMSKVEMGDPTDPSTRLGPMVRTELRDTLHSQVTESVEQGATVLLGGEQPDRPVAWYPAPR
jgi:acyl-CoA reductase-like NAD-dependent aldehyde dehydrogenase